MTEDMTNAGALIPISENNGKRAVSARDLHAFLESKQEFANWIKNRIEKYDLVENVDYVVFDKSVKNPNGGRPQIEYALTIDAAKELSMVEGNEKGKQARRYFIACEKRLTELSAPSYMIEDPIRRAEKWIEEQKQLKQLAEENEKQAEKIEHDKPKVLFADAVCTSKRSCLVAELAKIPCKKKGVRKRFLDLTGKRFGRLLVIKKAGVDKWGSTLWECKCDCGNAYIARSGKLVQGKTTNCGCYTSELRSKAAAKHGLLKHGIKPRTFIIWNGIKARCLNKKSISYKNYGARGITICDEWLYFENFHNWALRNGYKDDLTIDRIDNSKGYSPDNCKWIPWKENLMKQRRYILLTVDGETKTLSGWSKFLSVSRWILTKYFHLKGKEETEKAIADCVHLGKGQVYFVNKFLKVA